MLKKEMRRRVSSFREVSCGARSRLGRGRGRVEPDPRADQRVASMHVVVDAVVLQDDEPHVMGALLHMEAVVRRRNRHVVLIEEVEEHSCLFGANAACVHEGGSAYLRRIEHAARLSVREHGGHREAGQSRVVPDAVEGCHGTIRRAIRDRDRIAVGEDAAARRCERDEQEQVSKHQILQVGDDSLFLL